MNKTTRILLILFIVLGAGYWLVSQKPWRTVGKAAGDFSIKDTAAVTRIFLANKRGEKILLERQNDNRWLVNNNFIADEPKIKLLLATLHDIQVQMPVAPSMHNSVIAYMASKGVKTEIYAGTELLKTIYVGSETPDKTGTFMMLEGEDDAYAIQIPGFIGFLTPRFFLSEIKWRSKLLYDIPAEQLYEVRMTYHKQPQQSFTWNADIYSRNYTLLDYQGKEFSADTQQVKFFTHSFTQKYVEGYYEDSVFTPAERDSLSQLTPWCTIYIKLKSKAARTVILYEKPVGEKTKFRYDEHGVPLTIDPEKFFAKIDIIPQIASIQEYAFRPILVKQNWFIKKGYQQASP